MSKRLTGLNPLAYIGVESLTPPSMYIAQRAPTPTDSRNFNLGDMWLDEPTESLYVLVSLAQGNAIWITTFGGAATTFDTDNGTATDIGGVIALLGDGSTITTAAQNTNQVIFSLTQGLDGQLLIGADSASAQWADLTSADNSVLFVAGANTLDLTVNGSVVVGNGTNGQLLIGGGSAPQWASLTSDGSIVITPGVNSLEITAPNATGLTTVHTDSGTATQSAGAITVAGDGSTIATSGAGSTVTVEVKNGTNGQVLIGGGSAATWSTLTAGSNINITNGANSITISASGAGGGGATDFITDVGGPATETGGNITMAGGSNITTNGATPHTVTFNVSGTTNHAVQVGNSGGSLTSLGVGTNGQVLIGSTGANPQFNTLTSTGGTITFTTGPGTLNLEAVGGGGGGGAIITPFTANGTWTKNPSTKYVEVYGWGSGGGGGSGGVGGTVGMGGTGGGSTSMFHIYGPAAFFGATETVLVGAGGLGGASVSTANTAGNAGQPGTPSRFGGAIVPEVVFTGPGVRLSSAGLGGGVNVNGVTPGVGYAGIFEMGSNNIYTMLRGQSSTGIANRVAFGAGGGGSSFSSGAQGFDIGGDGAGNFYTFSFMLPTAGGGGSPWNSGGTFNNPGGNGGSVKAFDGTTTLFSGGLGGQTTIAPDGDDGTDAVQSDGSYLVGTSGIVVGGTGGGGGKGQFGGSTPGIGGNGGFPGGGGGGGGGAANGTSSGAGGNGADGLVLVIEWM